MNAEGSGSNLADVLERVLDKGVVIAGDIAINVVDVELLTLRLRLFIASAQTAKELGMDWWTNDPFFSPHAAGRGALTSAGTPAVNPADNPAELARQNAELRARVAELENASQLEPGK